MTNDPHPSRSDSPSPKQMASLAEWHWHWQADLDLADDDFKPSESPMTLVQLRALLGQPQWIQELNFHTEIEPGQIRLLSRKIIGDTIHPLYVLVLGAWNEQWLVAPFSRFPAPATSGEWFTGIDQPTFHTLCLWNARTCPSEALQCTWLEGSVETETLEDARQVFAHIMTGEKLSHRMTERLGATLEDPLDVRKLWQHEQIELLNPLTERSREWTEEQSILATLSQAGEACADFLSYRTQLLPKMAGLSRASNPWTEAIALPAAAGHSPMIPVLYHDAQSGSRPLWANDEGSAAELLTCHESQDHPNQITAKLRLLGAGKHVGSRFLLLLADAPDFPVAGGSVDVADASARVEWGSWDNLEPLMDRLSELRMLIL